MVAAKAATSSIGFKPAACWSCWGGLRLSVGEDGKRISRIDQGAGEIPRGPGVGVALAVEVTPGLSRVAGELGDVTFHESGIHEAVGYLGMAEQPFQKRQVGWHAINSKLRECPPRPGDGGGEARRGGVHDKLGEHGLSDDAFEAE